MNKDELTKELISCWESSPFPSLKITSYFPAYVEMFGHLVNKNCVFIETGILDGGSLFMWRKWLGPNARIIGVDLNPEAVKWKDHGFEIFIGDQGDPDFWQKTLNEIGEFDALLDDGGHQSFQQVVTAIEAIKFTKRKAVVAIEDTATSFMKDFARHGHHSFLEYCKDATDLLTGRSVDMYKNRFKAAVNTEALNEFKNVYSIQFYNGIVAFHINENYSETPKLVRNHPANNASDFRYDGADHALVNWPSLFKLKKIKIHGGKTFKEVLKDKVRAATYKVFRKIQH